MANVDKAFGLRPYKGLNTGSAVQQANSYSIDPSGYGTAIYQGDLVIFAGGYINRATTGVSTRELDSSTINTTQALQLKIVGVVQDDNNGDLGSNNANLVVQINEHAYRGPVAGT